VEETPAAPVTSEETGESAQTNTLTSNTPAITAK
jgi:hypothetical protein